MLGVRFTFHAHRVNSRSAPWAKVFTPAAKKQNSGFDLPPIAINKNTSNYIQFLYFSTRLGVVSGLNFDIGCWSGSRTERYIQFVAS